MSHFAIKIHIISHEYCARASTKNKRARTKKTKKQIEIRTWIMRFCAFYGRRAIWRSVKLRSTHIKMVWCFIIHALNDVVRTHLNRAIFIKTFKKRADTTKMLSKCHLQYFHWEEQASESDTNTHTKSSGIISRRDKKPERSISSAVFFENNFGKICDQLTRMHILFIRSLPYFTILVFMKDHGWVANEQRSTRMEWKYRNLCCCWSLVWCRVWPVCGHARKKN